MDSRKTTDLNNRSVKLTDAELSLVDRFSVSMPMNELPEIVVVGSAADAPSQRSSPTSEPLAESGTSQEEGPITIPFSAGPGTATQHSKKSGSDLPQTDLPEADLPETNLTVDSKASPQATQAAERELEMPADELHLSGVSPAGSGNEAEELAADEGQIYNIQEYSPFENYLDTAASSIEKNIGEQLPKLILLTAAEKFEAQPEVTHSLLMNLASRNPDWRMISIQLPESVASEQLSAGLGEVLNEKEGLAEVVIPTTVENLDFLAYTGCEEISDSVFGKRIESVLQELKKHYDIVLVSAPCAGHRQTRTLAKLANATYLLLEMDQVEKDRAVEATCDLRKWGAQMAGCILTESKQD